MNTNYNYTRIILGFVGTLVLSLAYMISLIYAVVAVLTNSDYYFVLLNLGSGPMTAFCILLMRTGFPSGDEIAVCFMQDFAQAIARIRKRFLGNALGMTFGLGLAELLLSNGIDFHIHPGLIYLLGIIIGHDIAVSIRRVRFIVGHKLRAYKWRLAWHTLGLPAITIVMVTLLSYFERYVMSASLSADLAPYRDRIVYAFFAPLTVTLGMFYYPLRFTWRSSMRGELIYNQKLSAFRSARTS